MFKFIIIALCLAGCSTLPKMEAENSESPKAVITANAPMSQPGKISDKDRAKIFSSFDYVNKQIWAIVHVPKDIEEYRQSLKGIQNGYKKDDVIRYTQEMQMFTCPLDNNFIVCGYIEQTYSFCDDARNKIDKDRYKDYIGKEDFRKTLSQSLGCK